MTRVISIYPPTFLVCSPRREVLLHLGEDKGTDLAGGILFAAGLAQVFAHKMRCLEGMEKVTAKKHPIQIQQLLFFLANLF